MVIRKTPKKGETVSTSAGVQNEENQDIVELHIWGGQWGLPSIDTESLYALAVTRFSGAPSKVIECNNPWKSPNWSLPFFKSGNKVFSSTEDLGRHLKSKNYNCDYSLSTKDWADVVAYQQYLKEAMVPALQYFFWIHNQNFHNHIRPYYGTRLPWLYKMWYPEQLQKRAMELITSIVPDAERNMDLCEEFILEKAGACIQLLSNKLGTNEFFLPQNSPSTLDALVFSHLAPFLKVPLTTNPIREFIIGHPNLEKFITRISQRYLSASGQGDVDQGPSSSSSSSSGPRGDFSSRLSALSPTSDNPTVRKFYAFLVASAVMVFYAYRQGMIESFQVRSRYHREEDDDDDDY